MAWLLNGKNRNITLASGRIYFFPKPKRPEPPSLWLRTRKPNSNPRKPPSSLIFSGNSFDANPTRILNAEFLNSQTYEP